jgi:hypothetical protein
VAFLGTSASRGRPHGRLEGLWGRAGIRGEVVEQAALGHPRGRGHGVACGGAGRRLEYAYHAGMADLLEIEDRSERIARRALYRGCSRLGETVVDVAERVVYAVMKES